MSYNNRFISSLINRPLKQLLLPSYCRSEAGKKKKKRNEACSAAENEKPSRPIVIYKRIKAYIAYEQSNSIIRQQILDN